MNRFKVIMTGRGHPDWAQEALDSVAAQLETEDRFDVCMVDDASEDLFELLAEYGDRYGWQYHRRLERSYALANQIFAWEVLEPVPDDVIVWVDLDDRLAVPDALRTVRGYYEAGALLTYGSYRPFPEDHPNAASCRPAMPYDATTVATRAYRGVLQWFNHLRTCSWQILSQITDEEFRRADGQYFKANTDRAVMFPALELAGRRAVCVPDVLYEYRCDSEDAVWRTMNAELVAEDRELRSRPRRGIW